MINYEAFYTVSYGLYLVSSGTIDKGNGFISNAVFQVTSVPPQFAVTCNKDNYSAEIIKKTGAFSISILKQDTAPEVIGKFGFQSGRDINKMDGTKIKEGITGVPFVLNDTLAILECKLKQTHEIDTHLLFIGEIINTEIIEEGVPLTYSYYRKVKKGLVPKNAPTYINKNEFEKMNVSDLPKYKCPTCGYIYDPVKGDEKGGIAPGTPFEELPDSWKCPVCGVNGMEFKKM